MPWCRSNRTSENRRYLSLSKKQNGYKAGAWGTGSKVLGEYESLSLKKAGAEVLAVKLFVKNTATIYCAASIYSNSSLYPFNIEEKMPKYTRMPSSCVTLLSYVFKCRYISTRMGYFVSLVALFDPFWWYYTHQSNCNDREHLDSSIQNTVCKQVVER